MANTYNGSTFAAAIKSPFMRKYIATAFFMLGLFFIQPAFAQDSSRLSDLDQKIDKSVRKESRAAKKVEKQRKKLDRKQKKLDRKQNKTDRRERIRNREERKLQREQEKRDTTTPSQLALCRREVMYTDAILI
jgi:low affinity Fe/Cu permease